MATAGSAGAIGIIQVTGGGASAIVEKLTGARPDGYCRLADLGGVDEGLVAAVGERWCELMPHGGRRVMQRLCGELEALGAKAGQASSPRALYPEAANDLEAMMLATLAKAASPAAMDALLIQPGLWRSASAKIEDEAWRQAVLERTARLDRLVHPPTVALVGRANVGKSTLTNRLMGQAASLVADLPGTTRDWVAGLAEVATPIGGLVVRWVDTPGLRPGADAIERQATALARQMVRTAEVVIAMRDHAADWPEAMDLPRRPDLWVRNKADLLAASSRGDGPAAGACTPEAPRQVSATAGSGLHDLARDLAHALGLDAELFAGPWAFCAELRQAVETGDGEAIRAWGASGNSG